MEENNVFEYIKTEENNYRTVRIPITGSKDWNMHEFVERCTNVSNGWFHSGRNDGTRPYDDIVTPIINVAFRSEGFDVKDIIPYVNDSDNYYKSFVVKKRHPQWARKNELDTFIDDVVETSVIYDLALIKKSLDGPRPEVIDLKTIAFCDQSDVMAGPICLKHNYTVADMISFKGKWDDDAIDRAVVLSKHEKKADFGEQTTKTPGKYIEVYELRGNLPEKWLKEDGEMYKYVPQMHIVCFYTDEKGDKQGITLYKGKDKPLKDTFKSLKIDRIRSRGRACGRSVVETLFEPQVWSNYSGIKIKQLLDAALTVFQTDSEELAGQKITDLKPNTILKHETGKPLTKLDGQIQNLTAFTNHQEKMKNDARVIGSANDAQLGESPTAGTPFKLQDLVVTQGQGIHEYRQGKIATFFADVLYPEWILPWLVEDLNKSKGFSENLSLDEMIEVRDAIATNRANKVIIDKILSENPDFAEGEAEQILEEEKQKFMKSGSRQFFTELENEFKDIPADVFINIKGKQKDFARIADTLTNIIREVMKNPQGFQQSGLAKPVNELLQASGLSPFDFSQITKVQPTQSIPQMSPAPAVPIG